MNQAINNPLASNALLHSLVQLASEIEDHANFVQIPQGQVLSNAGAPIKFVYFPATALISLVACAIDGDMVEVANIGADGMAGLDVLQNSYSQIRVVARRAGWAFRIRASILRDIVERFPALNQALLMYSLTLSNQIAKSALRITTHTVDQRVAQWLLDQLETDHTDQLFATQEFISTFLNVRREGVTASALKLVASGAISYRRGKITILDRKLLEHAAR